MAIDWRVKGGVERGRKVEIEVDGERVVAYEGESIAAALIASGRRAFRKTSKSAPPRGVFCGIGICFDCLMTVNGVPNTRTCVTLVEPGMVIRSQDESTWRGGQ